MRADGVGTRVEGAPAAGNGAADARRGGVLWCAAGGFVIGSEPGEGRRDPALCCPDCRPPITSKAWTSSSVTLFVADDTRFVIAVASSSLVSGRRPWLI